jgi:hypothetical protein
MKAGTGDIGDSTETNARTKRSGRMVNVYRKESRQTRNPNHTACKQSKYTSKPLRRAYAFKCSRNSKKVEHPFDLVIAYVHLFPTQRRIQFVHEVIP